MNQQIVSWIEKMSGEQAQCSCGKMCHIDFMIKHDYVELWVFCGKCFKTTRVVEPIITIKTAQINLIDKMMEALKRSFKRGCEEQ